MIKRLVIAVGILAAAGTAAAAQGVQNDRKLDIFGSDPCPAGYICVRKGEGERYRIPKTLRDNAPVAGNGRWADRAPGTMAAGASGTGSCTNTGGGGWTGCWSQMMRQAKQERKAKAEADVVPEK